MPGDKLKPDSTLGRVTVLVEERPKNRAAVRMHIRQTTAEEVLETIGVARERLEQLLRDGAKLTEVREVVTRVYTSKSDDPTAARLEALLEIRRILEAP